MPFQTAAEYRAQVAAAFAAKAEGEKPAKATRAHKTTTAPAEQAVDDAPAGDEAE